MKLREESLGKVGEGMEKQIQGSIGKVFIM